MKIDAFNFVFVMLVKQLSFLFKILISTRSRSTYTLYTHRPTHIKLETTQK